MEHERRRARAVAHVGEGIYGEAAAPAIVHLYARQRGRLHVVLVPLGHGSSTNADFAGTIARREVLLRYTNRYYLPEYAAYSGADAGKCNQNGKTEGRLHEQARRDGGGAGGRRKPHLTKEQAAELTTRLDWFRHFAVCNTTLDLSLWRFRYLRALAAKLTTDPKQMKELADAYDVVEAEQPKLFQFDPAKKMSCYRVPLGQIGRAPNLGNPRSLMHEIYTQSLAFVMESVGRGLFAQGVAAGDDAADGCSGEPVERAGCACRAAAAGRRAAGRGCACAGTAGVLVAGCSDVWAPEGCRRNGAGGWQQVLRLRCLTTPSLRMTSFSW